MTWSIDAEWYEPTTQMPPNNETILIYWLKEDWTEHRKPTCSIGFRFNRWWFIDRRNILQNHILAWTWLPKMPEWIR